MRPVTVTSPTDGLAQCVAVGPHVLTSDVALTDGGADAGPTPHEYLAAALAACTAITIRMVARRKGWAVGGLAVTVEVHHPTPVATPASAPAPGGGAPGSGGVSPSDVRAAAHQTVLARRITLPSSLSPDQRARLLAVADACPLHRALLGQIAIETTTG